MEYINYWSMRHIGPTMDTNRYIPLCLLLIGLPVLAEEPNFGFVEFNQEIISLHTNAKTADIKEIIFQYPGTDGKLKCCHRLTGKNLSTVGKSTKASSGDEGFINKYMLKYPEHINDDIFVGLALINVKSLVLSNINEMVGQTKEGKKIVIHKCLGKEGINLISSQTSLYYSFGYAIDLNDVKDEKVCRVRNGKIIY